MSKVKLGQKPYMYPMPTVLAGANVNGKANFQTVAFCGIVHYSPAMVAISIDKSHHTSSGIKENETFSINIPTESMAIITDYCGIVSGNKTDKSALFNIYYGSLETAPMIEECPVNLECKLVKTIDFQGNDDIFIGEIIEIYCNEGCMENGKPDMQKIKPLLFTLGDNRYWSVGEPVAKAWGIGKSFK